jgi:hypothetical protein
MRYGIYRTMYKSRKNHVILSHDDIKDMYYVTYKLYGKSEVFEYTHYNHACYKFDIIHKTFKELFPKTLLTNVK